MPDPVIDRARLEQLQDKSLQTFQDSDSVRQAWQDAATGLGEQFNTAQAQADQLEASEKRSKEILDVFTGNEPIPETKADELENELDDIADNLPDPPP